MLHAVIALSLLQEPAPEILAVKNRPAEDLVSVLRPLAGPNGSVTAFGGKLIVKASPEAMAQIKQVLPQLDVPPRSLMISVDQVGTQEGSERSAAASVVIAQPPVTETHSGNRVERRATRTVVTGGFSQSSAGGTSAGAHQLRALEGRPAFIRTGKAVPVAVAPSAVAPGGTTYAEADAGFYVVPRISGNIVTLEILASGDEVDDSGRMSLQRVETTVTSRLGEWVLIGGIERNETAAARGIASSDQAKSNERRSVRVKVEEVP